MTAPRTISGSPLVTPPVSPPALFDAVDPMAVGVPALDDVVDRRAEAARLLEAEPELDALDDVDAHDGRRERGIEPAVPVDVRAQPDGQPVDHDLEDAADRVAGRPRLVDAGDHRGLRVGVGAAQRGVVGLVTRPGAVGRVDRHAADLGRERPGLDAELAQEGPGDAAGGDPCRGLARGRALEHVAHVREPVLERPGEVGMAGTDPRDRGRPLVPVLGRGEQLVGLLVAERPDLHDPRPVLPVAVADEQQDRRAEGQAVPDAAEDLGAVVLDRLARAAPVPALAAGEVDRERVLGQRQPGRDALDGGAERRPVRFARGQEAEGSHHRRRGVRVRARAVSRPWRRRPTPRPPARPPARPRPIGGRRRAPRRASPASARAGPSGRSTA